jgi:dTDP-glucose pyrophosphorylase
MSNPDQHAWSSALLTINSTIQDAIQSLNASTLQIVLVVDEHGKLLGTVTDGDIRRGLLRGLDLRAGIEQILFTTPLVAPPEMSREMVLHLMRVNRLLQMPVVDGQHKVVGLHLWNDIIAQPERKNLMVIMAGGMGTRLLPYTEDCPKPMLPVAGKPMLEHIIERAKNEGFRHFVLAVRYLAHMIEDYFGDGAKWDVSISYLHEDTPLGTAGALGLLDPKPTEPVVVTNGDVLTDVRYGEIVDFHQYHHAAATMAVRLHEWQHPFGVVQTKGVSIVGFEEKPVFRTHVNAGIYVLGAEALRLVPSGKSSDMPDIFELLRLRGERIIAYPMHEIWTDVGRPDDLKKVRNEMRPESAK